MSDAPDAGRSLWRRYRRARGPVGPGPSEAALAAFLDGRVSDAERDAIEAWLADDAEALDFVVARRLGPADTAPAPRGVAARAKGLVRAPGLADRLRALAAPFARPWPVTAGAAVTVAAFAVAGLELGQATYRHALAVEVAVAGALVLGARGLPVAPPATGVR